MARQPKEDKMTGLGIIEREMTEAEFARMNAGFDEYAIEHGNPTEISERFGFVAMDGEELIGCSSGLAYQKTSGYSRVCLRKALSP